MTNFLGRVAQLEARLVHIEEVPGSNPGAITDWGFGVEAHAAKADAASTSNGF